MTADNFISLTLVAAVLATMPVFAFRSRSRVMDADVARRSVTPLIGFWLRDWVMWVISPIERLLVSARVSPDVFNYLGVAFGAAAAGAFAWNRLALAGWMILLGGLCDIFDGRIARARGLASAYGAFLDSTLDRFAEVFTFLGVAWYLSGNPLTVTLALLAAGGSMLVSYTRARGEALGVDCKSGLMQRAERLIILALAALFDGPAAGQFGWAPGTLLAGAVGVIGVLSMGTAIYRTWFISRALAAKDDPAR